MRWLAILAGISLCTVAQARDLAYVDEIAPRGAIVIDSRPLADCRRASLPGARCLPAEEFLDPRRRLPGERDLLWLLGTAGLDGSETVLVVGHDTLARDFVAGLLYLAGQRNVRIHGGSIAAVASSPGQVRGMVRSAVWTAPMREQLWVLGADILREKPILIDARASVPGMNAGNGVVVARDAYAAIAYFAKLRAGHGPRVRVHPGGSAAWLQGSLH